VPNIIAIALLSRKFTLPGPVFPISWGEFMKVFIDGKYCDERTAKVSVFDHGLLYGDGIFEGIRAYNGRVFKLREHIDRLFCSAKAILLEIPMSYSKIMRAVVEACRMNKIHDGYIRLLVTRGVGSLGLNPHRCKKPSVIIIADKIQLYPPAYYRNGMEIVTVPTTRSLHSALNPAIKSLNYLNNILAKIEANNAGCEEAVMLNAEGYVAECTGDNLFIAKNGELFTPPLSAGALYGITRQVVMELAEEEGLAVSEPNLTRYDLFNADECFLTGTGAEIVPVVKIDGRIIGTGKPGPITRKLEEEYRSLTTDSGEPIYR
jgi:branched-chain amino acid aminotransferase